MSVANAIRARGILEVLHFTTNRGVLGTLYTGALKSRQRLPKEESLEFIFQMNAPFRKDVTWLDYVNLSITRINGTFFDICSEKWHKTEDIWWAVLAFEPDILAHEGIYFTTTNNIYPSVQRGTGALGLEAMFAKKVIARYGAEILRTAATPDNWPTCPQSEVLYPMQVAIQHLRTIYVRTEAEAHEASAQLEVTHRRGINVVVNPKIFQ